MGDVIEHLPAPFEVVQQLVAMLRPGGWLMAQGPLEAGPCLFATALRAATPLRARRVTQMPPYHVLQATVRGQRAFFERVGLAEVTYVISEVAWPAPARLSMTDVQQPRKLALFLLRRLSQLSSKLNPTGWGNRYFFVGAAGVRAVLRQDTLRRSRALLSERTPARGSPSASAGEPVSRLTYRAARLGAPAGCGASPAGAPAHAPSPGWFCPHGKREACYQS